MKKFYMGGKLVLTCIVLLVLGANKTIAQCTSSAQFNFSNAAFFNSVVNGKAITNGGVTVTISTSVMTGGTSSGVSHAFSDDDRPTTLEFGVKVTQTSAQKDAGVKTKFVFSKPLRQFKMTIWDIDGGSGRRDSVNVRGFNGASLINLTSANYTFGAGTVVANSGTNQFRATSNIGTGDDDVRGDVYITFPQPVDSVIVISSQSDLATFGSSTSTFNVSIGQFQWCNSPDNSCALRDSIVFGTANVALADGATKTSTSVSNPVTMTINRFTTGTSTFGTFKEDDDAAHKPGKGSIYVQSTTPVGSATQPGVKVKLSFNKHLVGLRLSIWDLDGGTNKRDSVKILGYFSGAVQALDSTNYSYGNCMNTQKNGTGFKATSDLGNDANETFGDVNILFPSPTDSVIIWISQAQGGSNSSGTLAISGISWCNSIAQAPLPVKLSELSGNVKNGNVSLNWTTYEEIQLNRIAIQRSFDGSTFSEVGSLPAMGAQSKTDQTHYQFNDDLSGNTASKVFYRLHMIDNDGSYKVSNVVALRLKGTITKLAISPNPTTDHVALSFTASKPGLADIRLVDITGKVLINKQLNVYEGANSTTLMNLDKLTNGIYTMVMRVDGDLITEKLVIRK